MNRATALAAALVLLLAGCSSSNTNTSDTDSGDGASTITVSPDGGSTIQDALDDAETGDTINILNGTYNEELVVETAGIIIVGESEEGVVLDGNNYLVNGLMVFSNDVTVQNLTVKNYEGNGVFFSGTYGDTAQLDGYHVEEVTAENNGSYGIYAYGSENGQILNTTTEGHPDGGIYIGKCNPCNVTVEGNVAQNNAVGILLTNASVGINITNNLFSNNRTGVELASSTLEDEAPQTDVSVTHNIIKDNNNKDAPRLSDAFGIGVLITGGQNNTVSGNTITNHATTGVLVTDGDGYLGSANTIAGNDVTGSEAPYVQTSTGTPSCFATVTADQCDITPAATYVLEGKAR